MVRRFGAVRDHHVAAPTQSCAGRREHVAAGSARSSLKMKWLIRPVHGFPRDTGWVMPPASKGMVGIDSEVRPAACRMDQFSDSWRHPPAWVHPSPKVRGGVRSRAKAHGEPIGGKHDRVCADHHAFAWRVRVLEGWLDKGVGIGCRHDMGSGCNAFQGTPSGDRW